MEEPRSFRLPLQSNIAKLSVTPSVSTAYQEPSTRDPDFPTVELTVQPFTRGKRTAAQQAELDAVAASAGADIFGDDRKTAYWHVRLRHEQTTLPLKYLFNVIVALEWTPSANYLRMLHQGLRRASDLLYDVTDGQMAFGKVTIADASWMNCADIQIMASNRILPRSWTGGLIETAKYAPVRAGRGVWVRDRHEVQDWDTANAYHTLIHEWLHYALFLRDEYLTAAQPYKLAGKGKRAQKHYLVLPIGGLGIPSIMSTPVGHSELSRQSLCNPDGDSIKLAYPDLTLGPGQRDPGPYRLPLQLPVFQLAGQFGADQTFQYLQDVLDTEDFLLLGNVPDASREEQQLTLGAGIDIGLSSDGPDLLAARRAKFRQGHGGSGARRPLTFESESVLHIAWEAAVLRVGGEQIVAQGTLDAVAMRPKPSEFTLCGTGAGDDVLIIGGGNTLAVFRGKVTANGASVTADQHVPADRPMVDVFPGGDPNKYPREVNVRAEATGPQSKTWTPQVFPRGKRGDDLTALDGQVCLTHNGDKDHPLVCSYSRGGGGTIRHQFTDESPRGRVVRRRGDDLRARREGGGVAGVSGGDQPDGGDHHLDPLAAYRYPDDPR